VAAGARLNQGLHRYNGGDSDMEDDDEERSGVSPLYVAVDQKRNDVVMALAACGANLNTKLDYEIASPLYLAVNRNTIECVKVLLACGSSVRVRNDQNHYSLLKAVQFVAVARLLVAFGADINARTSVNWTNLDFTTTDNQLDLGVHY
jgi:ankyrin repeat protein